MTKRCWPLRGESFWHRDATTHGGPTTASKTIEVDHGVCDEVKSTLRRPAGGPNPRVGRHSWLSVATGAGRATGSGGAEPSRHGRLHGRPGHRGAGARPDAQGAHRLRSSRPGEVVRLARRGLHPG